MYISFGAHGNRGTALTLKYNGYYYFPFYILWHQFVKWLHSSAAASVAPCRCCWLALFEAAAVTAGVSIDVKRDAMVGNKGDEEEDAQTRHGQ